MSPARFLAVDAGAVLLHTCSVLQWLSAGLMLLGPIPGSPPIPKLTNISTVEHFKRTFNADAGKVRLVLLLSPT